MDLHVTLLLLLCMGAAVQPKPRLCNGEKQQKDEVQNEDDVSARSFNRLSILRPGLIFRASASSADHSQSNNKRPGNIGLLHGSGGAPNGGYGVIHGGGEKHLLNRNKIFGQGVSLRNNTLSQKLGSLINHQPFGILSGNSLNVNRTQQNNSGPSYQVYLPSGLHQINPVGGQLVGGGGGYGGTSGGILSHGFRPHHHMGGPATHQGGHLSGLLGHHHSHPHHSLHPLTHHSHHGSHGPAVLGNAGIGGARPGHHQHNGGLLGSNHLSGVGAGPLHGKPGGLGLIHGGLGGGGQAYGNIIGHRPLTHGALGLVHGAFGNQGSTSNSEVNNAAQTQQHHGGLIGLLHNGLGAQGVLIGSVGGNNHFAGGSGLGSSHVFGQHGLLNLIHGVHGATQGGNFQTVTGSELKPGHVYLHLGALGVQQGGQTGGTAASNFQSVGGSSIGSGQVYGHGGGQVLAQSGQGAQGQIFGTGSHYQTGGTSTSQSGQFQSQHNLHQGTLNQGGATAITSNTGGYGVTPGQQSYQGSIYETQWRPPHAVSSTTGSSAHAGTVGLSSSNSNSYNQVSQGNNNFVSGTSEESLYGNQNIYEGNDNQYATSQSTNGNYYNYGQIPTTTDTSGSYGFNQGYPVGLYNQTFGQGHTSGGTLTQHSHQSSSSSSFGSNSSSQAEESSSQESHYSGGNLVGVNSGDTSYTSVVHGQPSSINYVGGDQSSQQNHLNSNTQGQSNYISGTNTFQNSGGVSGQYMGDYESAVFSGSYPHQQDNYNSQKQGNYAHGSLIYVIQQSPLADETSYIGENDASVSGSITGSGTNVGGTSSMYNNKLVNSGDSGSSISTSQNYLGPHSANQVKYGGSSSSSSFQSGSQGSTSTQPLNSSGNILSGGSASHSFNSSPGIGTSGSSGISGSSYNTQYSRPSSVSAATQSADSNSQNFNSSNAFPQYESSNSAVVSGNFGSTSSSVSSNADGNSFSTVNKENAVSEGVNTDSNGEVLSTQSNGQGQYTSGGSFSSSSNVASTTNHGLQFNNSGSSSNPSSSSLSTNQELLSGTGHSSNFPLSSGTSVTSVSGSNTVETHGTMSSTQTNTVGQFGHSGTSSTMESTNNESSYNGIHIGETEAMGSFLSGSKEPSSEGVQQSPAISNVGATQQHHISGPSPSTGILVGGESGYSSSNGAYSSSYGNQQMLASNTAGSSSPHFAASGNLEHNSAHGSILHGGSDQTSNIGGEKESYTVTSTLVNNKELDTKYNNHNLYHDKTGTQMTNLQDGSTFQVANINKEQSSSNTGTMYQSSVSGNTQLSGTESVSFVASNNNPPPNTVSSFSGTDNANSVGSQMYGVSPNKGGHVSSSGGYGHQSSSFAVQSNANSQHTALGSEESQASGLVETAGVNSQHTYSSVPSGSSSVITSQSSSVNSENSPDTYGAFSNEHGSGAATGHISNQYSNLGMTSSTSGGSGNYELLNENHDKHMISSGSLVSGSSGSSDFEASKYPSSNSHTQLSGSTHGNNQLFSSSSSNFGGVGNNSPSTSATSQHYGTAGYTPGGNTEIMSSNTNINGHSSMLNTQGQSPVGLTTGGGINKEFTGNVQTNSFRYPGQYTFKYGYVHPNNMYTSIDYPTPNSYDPANIVYSGNVNPNSGSNGFYYHYSTAGNPIKISSIESYPVQTSDQDYLKQPLYTVGSDQSGPLPLSSNVDEEDDSYEETQINNGVTGNLHGHFEHSGGGNVEGSINRPFHGGLSFVGNHELNTGVSGSVSGHLGNFQGFLGNAANKVGGLISGVGQVVGIIRDEGESQATGGVDSQGYIIGSPQKVQGILRTNNQPILEPLLIAQNELQTKHTFPVYIQENSDKTFSDGKHMGTELQTTRLILPSNIATFREPKGVTQKDDNLNRAES